MQWWEAAYLCCQQGKPCVVVTVAAVFGSAPREVGAGMVVAMDALSGTVGGGKLEFQAIQQARAVLVAGEPASSSQEFTLGVQLGQCCGGVVTLHYQLLQGVQIAEWLDTIQTPDFHIALFGAGHVGQAVVTVLAALPCRMTWVDSRMECFPAQVPVNVRICPEVLPVQAVSAMPAGSYYLVMTHDHALDLDLCGAILARQDSRFVGLIGSRTKAARFRQRLQQRGIPPEALGRLVCPVGLTGIRDKHPAAIAVAIVAQLLLLKDAPVKGE